MIRDIHLAVLVFSHFALLSRPALICARGRLPRF